MKNLYFLLAVLLLVAKPGISQEDEPQSIKKMNASADLTVQWLKKNARLSEEQGEALLKVLKVPAQTFKDLGSLSKEYPDSLQIMQARTSAKIRQDILNILTEEQLNIYNSKKEEFNLWLEKKLKEKGL